MSGVLTIKSDEKGVSRISVKNPKPDPDARRFQILVLIFWLTVLFAGIFFLADLTENFSNLEPIITHFNS